MHIKIYFDDKPIYICDEISSFINDIILQKGTIFIKEANKKSVDLVLSKIKQQEFNAAVLFNVDFDFLKNIFFKKFTLIEAAGGIVLNNKNDILFIYRLNKWDLPKGKIEKNETPNFCALREIEEETGAINLSILKDLGKTYHTYHHNNKFILKTTFWFLIKSTAENNLKPQIEENITEIKWVNIKDLTLIIENTYPSIIDIVNEYVNITN